MTIKRRVTKATCIGTLVSALTACNTPVIDYSKERVKEWQIIEQKMNISPTITYFVLDNEEFSRLLDEYIVAKENYNQRYEGKRTHPEMILHPTTGQQVYLHWPRVTNREEIGLQKYLKTFEKEPIFMSLAGEFYVFQAERGKKIYSQSVSVESMEPFFNGISSPPGRQFIGYGNRIIAPLDELLGRKKYEDAQPLGTRTYLINDTNITIETLRGILKHKEEQLSDSTDRARVRGWPLSSFKIDYNLFTTDSTPRWFASWTPKQDHAEIHKLLSFFLTYQKNDIFVTGTDSTLTFFSPMAADTAHCTVYLLFNHIYFEDWVRNSIVTEVDTSH